MAKITVANPSRRPSKRRTTKRKTTKRRSPSRGVAVRKSSTPVRRRRNPARRRSSIMQQVQTSAVGAGGALAVDIAMQKLPFIPENLRTGPMAAATKGAVSVGIGMLVGKFMKNKRLGEQLASGGMTVALYDAAKGMIGPSLGLGDYDSLLGLGDYSELLGYQSMNTDSYNSGMGDWTNPGVATEFDPDYL
jgi:hypothetical protein